MNTESEQLKSEPELFLNAAIDEVKEFITGHPDIKSTNDVNQALQAQKELHAIRNIRNQNKDLSHSQQKSRVFDNLRYERAANIEERKNDTDRDKDETERDYE